VMITDDHQMSQEKLQQLKVGLGVKAVVSTTSEKPTVSRPVTFSHLQIDSNLQNFQKPSKTYITFQINAIIYFAPSVL
jgi:hypothetical protein